MSKRPRLLSALAMAAVLAMAAPARAEDAPWGDDVAVIADGEMEDLRGGFNINGIEIQFGVLITTLLDGVPVLQTHFTIGDDGALIERAIADLGVSFADLTPEERAAFGVEGLDGANGIVLESESGVTALIHNVTDTALQNIVVNTADDMNIEQQFEVTLKLPNFGAIQAGYDFAYFGFNIDRDLTGVRFD